MRGKIVVKTSFRPGEAIGKVKRRLAGYDKIVATGYGRNLVDGADLVVTEISAFARGASHINPEVRTIIDLGGQDSKVIRVEKGRPVQFVMNDRCAAGSGNFIEKTAQALGLSLDEFGRLATKSGKPEMIDSLCVVMAETEVLSLVAEGKNLADIAAGICDTLIRRIAGFGARIGVAEEQRGDPAQSHRCYRPEGRYL
ncbi:MAG TPA: hypothetical protein EYP24_05815 [bacterium (Candidatus Stahlbacteria)]|nr:hypothetical protein [Candidatus Stahlbacteria bacterium]